jgi:EmrB/QacA subfamily drug resistance transporter
VTAPGLRYQSAPGRWVLLATILGSGMAQLDGSVVGVALPKIGTDLKTGLTSLQWTVNAYTLTLSGLLLLGGSLGDRMGRKRIFVLGMIWFASASAGCALAPTADVLIGMRGLQGIGAALLTPGSLAILEAVFVKEDRGSAIGAWTGLGGVASALGPVIGGLLVAVAPWGWRLVFLINLPLAALAILVSIRHIPETRDEQAGGQLDISGAVLFALGLAGVVFALTEGPDEHWPAALIFSLVLGITLLGAFIMNEARRHNPMMALSLFRSRQFSSANLATLLIYAALAGALFLLPVQLQRVTGFSPVASGSALLPLTVVMLLLSARMGKLASRIGPRWPMTIGPLISAAGLVLLAQIDAHTTYVTGVLPAVLVFGIGLSITVAPLTATVLAAAPHNQVGVASAINNDVARTGGLFAVAVLPALAGLTQAAYRDPARLSQGFHNAVLISAVACACGGVLAGLTISNAGFHRGRPHGPAATPAQSAPGA